MHTAPTGGIPAADGHPTQAKRVSELRPRVAPSLALPVQPFVQEPRYLVSADNFLAH